MLAVPLGVAVGWRGGTLHREVALLGTIAFLLIELISSLGSDEQRMKLAAIAWLAYIGPALAAHAIRHLAADSAGQPPARRVR